MNVETVPGNKRRNLLQKNGINIHSPPTKSRIKKQYGGKKKVSTPVNIIDTSVFTPSTRNDGNNPKKYDSKKNGMFYLRDSC